jgi:hypothetical protein
MWKFKPKKDRTQRFIASVPTVVEFVVYLLIFLKRGFVGGFAGILGRGVFHFY